MILVEVSLGIWANFNQNDKLQHLDHLVILFKIKDTDR